LNAPATVPQVAVDTDGLLVKNGFAFVVFHEVSQEQT
jgi:hypothetical protein